MKSVKRILAVLMAVLFAVSMFSVCAFAEDAQGESELKVTLSTPEDVYELGDTVVVNVKISTNFNYTTFRFPIMYDSSVYEIESLDLEAYGAVNTNGSIMANENGEGFIPESYSADAWGCIAVQWIGTVKAGSVGVLNTNGVEVDAFSFKLKVKGDAVRGTTGTIFIPDDYNGFYNQSITDVTDATTIKKIESLKMTFVDANPEVAADDIDIVKASDSSTAVIDKDKLYVYGLEVGMKTAEDFAKFIKINKSGNYSYDIVFTTYGVGTNALINVMDGEKIVKTYTVIIFGDYNGDGDANGLDLPELVKLASGTMDPESKAQEFALDFNLDDRVDGLDLPVLVKVAAGTFDINQVNPSLS